VGAGAARFGQLTEHLDYFREQLRGLVPLQLPTDRPRPAVPTFHGASHSVRVPADVVQRLKALARQQNASLFMLRSRRSSCCSAVTAVRMTSSSVVPWRGATAPSWSR